MSKIIIGRMVFISLSVLFLFYTDLAKFGKISIDGFSFSVGETIV